MNKKAHQLYTEIKTYSEKHPKEINIVFEDNRLVITTPKGGVLGDALFGVIIFLPFIGILLFDFKNLSLVISTFWVLFFTYKYIVITRYEAVNVFDLSTRILTHKKANWLHRIISNEIQVRFEDLQEVHMNSVYSSIDNYSFDSKIRIDYNSLNFGKIPIVEVSDRFISNRLKFVLTEIVKLV